MTVYRVDLDGHRNYRSFWVEAPDIATAYLMTKNKFRRDHGWLVQFQISKATRPPVFGTSGRSSNGRSVLRAEVVA